MWPGGEGVDMAKIFAGGFGGSAMRVACGCRPARRHSLAGVVGCPSNVVRGRGEDGRCGEEVVVRCDQWLAVAERRRVRRGRADFDDSVDKLRSDGILRAFQSR